MIYILATVKIQNSVIQTMKNHHGASCLIKNKKQRTLLIKGSNFRELEPLNFSKCENETDYVFEEFNWSLRLKYKLEDTAIDLWLNKVLKSQKQSTAIEKVEINLCFSWATRWRS